MTGLNKLILLLALPAFSATPPQGWTPAAEVRHDDTLCVSYQARLDGAFVVVRVLVEPGWHTFAMDNRVRAEEKLAGKQSLGIDQPTEITLSGGLQAAGPWYQSPPKDFSRPELRWFSWGFEKQAVFAVKIRRSSNAAARISIRGQACTETLCKNVEVTIPLLPVNVRPDAEPSEVNLKNLLRVKTALSAESGRQKFAEAVNLSGPCCYPS
jgi:hypothetical protein